MDEHTLAQLAAKPGNVEQRQNGNVNGGYRKCSKCSNQASPENSTCARCRDRARLIREQKAAAGLCTDCGKPSPAWKCPDCLARCNVYRPLETKRLRAAMFAHYGGAECAECGFSAFTDRLQCDHLQDDGARHRKHPKYKRNTLELLRKRGWPPGMQILCSGCNGTKGPHRILPGRHMQWLIENLESDRLPDSKLVRYLRGLERLERSKLQMALLMCAAAVNVGPEERLAVIERRKAASAATRAIEKLESERKRPEHKRLKEGS